MIVENEIICRFNVRISADKCMDPDWNNSLIKQIELIDRASISQSVNQIFRKIPIIIHPLAKFGARYRVNVGVEVGSLAMPIDRPIILHEMMHAFHHSEVLNGFHNADILEFYRRALVFKIYPMDSYMLRSVQEFFAVTASCLVHERIMRPPFTRKNLKNKQPNYYRWLSELLQYNIVDNQNE